MESNTAYMVDLVEAEQKLYELEGQGHKFIKLSYCWDRIPDHHNPYGPGRRQVWMLLVS